MVSSIFFRGDIKMSKICDICGKGRQVGYNVSHAKNRTKKVWNANLKKVKIVDEGTTKTVNVCTTCLTSDKVVKKVRTS